MFHSVWAAAFLAPTHGLTSHEQCRCVEVDVAAEIGGADARHEGRFAALTECRINGNGKRRVSQRLVRDVRNQLRHGDRIWFVRAEFVEDRLRLRRLGEYLPLLYRGTVLDGELVAGRFHSTMAALTGSRRFRADLRFVVFDVPYLAGTDLRHLPWHERRQRLELLALAFEPPYELSALVEPSADLARQIADGDIEGVVLKDRSSTYRAGSRSGWSKLKDPRWAEREAWRFESKRRS